jgi:signal transduction histidine kinase
VEPLSDANRACAVAAAAAHDFNNELTVIMSSVAGALGTLDEQHPARELLLDIQAAAQRCVWKASGLLNFSARVNPSPIRASFEFLIDKSPIDQ